MKVQFCGAAQQVTGSSHLIVLDDGYKILLDCGLYQGSDDDMVNFNQKFLFNPADIDCLIISHAHIDHTGRVPQLVKEGFRGQIFCTHATRSIASLMLMDSAKIQQSDAAYQSKKQLRKVQPLYTTKDVRKTLELAQGLSFERWHYVTDNVRVFFRDAGHILGSASVSLEIKENNTTKRFGFTGDIGRPFRPILKDPLPMPEVDYLICESTYGHKEHKSAPAELDELLEIIEETCVKNKGKLIIPAFSVGRTQEIIYMLDQLSNERSLPRIPVYVDSPLAVNATDIFRMHPECFDEELLEYIEFDPNPFGFKDLNYVQSISESKQINKRKEPAIIISSSGMITAGRIRHHVFNNIENPNNGILIVGYCAPQTVGGQIRDGKPSIRLFGQKLQVKAKVHVMDSFSAHADRTEIYEFIKNQRPKLKELFLVHGTLGRQKKFQKYLGERGFENVRIPVLGDTFEM